MGTFDLFALDSTKAQHILTWPTDIIELLQDQVILLPCIKSR
jgi:hypothetical protein